MNKLNLQRFIFEMTFQEKEVFSRVFHHRAIQFQNLKREISQNGEESLNCILEKLSKKDFDTILVTALGFELARHLKR